MRAVTRPLGLACLLLASNPTFADYQLNLAPGVTSTSQNSYDIHQIVMWICVIIGIVVYGVMTYSILTHTKAKNHKPATFDDNLTIEILWTIIPVLILIGMAVPATSALLAMEDTSNSDMSIKVTGYRWKWHYDYVGEDVSFFSNLST
ncbi:Cytochrome c oxidase polypeptide II, partial [hydrothermal vent metagenome]